MTGGLLRKLDGDWSVKPFTFNGSKFNVRSLDNIASAQSVRVVAKGNLESLLPAVLEVGRSQRRNHGSNRSHRA